MIYISDLADELRSMTKYQQLPEEMDDEEYEDIIVHAVKRLFIDTGRALSFDNSKIDIDAGTLDYDLPIDEME